ncbi:hypothetical protein F5X68DRAFT_10252 [Plectosphaerella plurivora]|uniref:GMP synthase n=1 Tax=Plectosphaerella plurivora TaxID=936078 RepID=A0A9P9AAH8_9PEZI|nr:hypothetical protein F5X68DRAFT_10252 [Plectosphaerella plurivora]
MPDFKGIVKNGWHPEKPGTTFKSQMGSIVGRKNSDDKRREEHVARPISSLRDPNSFAPPPRRDPRDPLPAVSRTNTASSVGSAPPPAPARAGAAEPPSYNESNSYAQRNQPVEEEAPPKKPWSLNTTGLKTDHLPPPPLARRNPAAPPPPAARTSPAGGPPSLPPRLPPRTGSGASSPAAAPSPPLPSSQPPGASSGYLNQSAISRLGSSGISVPGFGIGKSASPEPTASPSAAPPSGTHMNELQNRFSKLGKSSLGGGGTANPPPTQGTTMEQKQAALRTASNFHKDPSSVSMSDARGAASTFNNFRQRHGDQVAAGARSANNLNQKYGVADKLGGFAAAGGQAQVGRQEEGVVGGSNTTAPVSPGIAGVLGKKKPPPPPPKKKPGLGGPPPPPGPSGGDDDGAPPPIPLSTRPNW